MLWNICNRLSVPWGYFFSWIINLLQWSSVVVWSGEIGYRDDDTYLYNTPIASKKISPMYTLRLSYLMGAVELLKDFRLIAVIFVSDVSRSSAHAISYIDAK